MAMKRNATDMQHARTSVEAAMSRLSVSICNAGDIGGERTEVASTQRQCALTCRIMHSTWVEIVGYTNVIPRQAFLNCRTMSGVTFPDTLIRIRYSAFRGCQALEEVVIPGSVVHIEPYAFSHCTSLTRVHFPKKTRESHAYIADMAFAHCASLTDVELPDGSEEISHGAFLGCSNLASVTIPNSVTTIGSLAFCDSALSEVVLPAKCTIVEPAFPPGCSITRRGWDR